ncbi:uncharacterized protein [Rutidosis leptorrhynchoides]|uniref:uncharacterized protein n=1 Tax=Rutidosis leptorrhynchoides TaxID=125765 RepID=UPI003A9A65BF
MEHEQQQEVSIGSTCDKFPHLSSKYPRFIAQNIEDEDVTGTEIFSTLHNPLIRYQCEIPEFNGRRIRGCFHGWLILSNHPHNDMWSLWNPMSLKIISLPPLKLKHGDGKSIYECLLTAPPDDPTSVFLLTRHDASTFVYCLLNRKRKMMKWTEKSYLKQLKRLTYEGKLIRCLTCCNGRIYALIYEGWLCSIIIQVEIVVKKEEVMIQLLLFGNCPQYDSFYSMDSFEVIKGYGTELFFISVGYLEETEKIGDVCLFRLDSNSINWEELEVLKQYDVDAEQSEDDEDDYLEGITQEMWEQVTDLKDAVFYLDLGFDHLENYNPAVASSELGGYIHIRPEEEEILYSYHVADRTIVPSAMPSRVVSTTRLLMWEGRLEDDNVEVNCISTFKQENDEQDEVVNNVSCIHNIPFDVLQLIMEYCVGVEYLNFRATCKLCHIAAPSIQWRDESSLRRLHNYTLNTPWLMVAYEYREIVTFTDPLSGDNYFMKKNWPGSFLDNGMFCSRFGWLLCKCNETEEPLLFNPMTRDRRNLPDFITIESLCFSATPDSSNCVVAGFLGRDLIAVNHPGVTLNLVSIHIKIL